MLDVFIHASSLKRWAATKRNQQNVDNQLKSSHFLFPLKKSEKFYQLLI